MPLIARQPPHSASAAIGVFDSGVGGLSVLRALRQELPQERFVYVSDAGHAPYGEKDDRVVRERSQTITRYLRSHHHIKILVVACNTATAAAIAELRTTHPSLPIVGIEPAIKPALAQSRTGRVAVMATRGTLLSQKFQALMATLPRTDGLVLQACDGLADAIERNDAIRIEALCAQYIGAIGDFGTQSTQIDTLVLGCTHYPFAQTTLRQFTGSDVLFLEGGAPVARRVRMLLEAAKLLALTAEMGSLHFLTSGKVAAMTQAIERWLGVVASVEALPAEQTV